MTADDQHADVLRAAAELFAQHGFSKVTIRAIAARAGTSPALVMKVGGSKNDLFHRTAAIAPPVLPDVPTDELGRALVDNVIERHRRDEIEHLVRALVLKLHAPDPEEVRTQFLAGYVDPLEAALAGPDSRIRAELAVAALGGLASMLRFFEPAALNADLDEVAVQYGPVVQQLLDGGTPIWGLRGTPVM